MNRRLGRGLDSLLGDARSSSDSLPTERATVPPAPAAAQPRASGAVELELHRIRPNPFQPRTTFDPEGLEELKESIRIHGVLQPVVVRPHADGFELIAGERRWRASRLAGRTTVPAVVRTDVDDRALLELALVENLQRRDLDPMERAQGYRRAIAELGLTQEQVAERVGLKRSTVTNQLRLLELPAEAQEAVRRGLISMGHARALLALVEAGPILAAVQRIVREGLSVRQVEELARTPRPQTASKSGSSAPGPKPAPWERELETRMRATLGSPVHLHNREGYRGTIVIDYFDRADLDRLIAILAPRREL